MRVVRALASFFRRQSAHIESETSPQACEARLVKAVKKSRLDVAARFLLIDFYFATEQPRRAIECCEQALITWPENVELLLRHARCHAALFQYRNAADTFRRALALHPNHADAWLRFAYFARDSQDPQYVLPSESDDAFRKSVALSGRHPLYLRAAAEHFLQKGEVLEAEKLFEEELSTADTTNPEFFRDYARCLRKLGRWAKHAQIVDRGLDVTRALATTSDGESLDRLRQTEATLLLEAGRIYQAAPVLRELKASMSQPAYDRPEYLPQTLERLSSLRETVAARDLLLFLQGPSMADFTAQMDKLQGLNLAFATLGAFPPVEHELQKHLRRDLDVICISHPDTVRSWRPELNAFLRRKNTNLLVTSNYVLSKLGEIGLDPALFKAEFDKRLLVVEVSGGPPIPSLPLHFESPGNSLSIFLPLLVLALPRRIFLIGADGGVGPGVKRPYFFSNDFDASDADLNDGREGVLNIRHRDVLNEVHVRLRSEAMNCDRICHTAFAFLDYLFDVSTPPIYNVCPSSAHQAFPRIDFETAIRMLHNKIDLTRAVNTSAPAQA